MSEKKNNIQENISAEKFRLELLSRSAERESFNFSRFFAQREAELELERKAVQTGAREVLARQSEAVPKKEQDEDRLLERIKDQYDRAVENVRKALDRKNELSEYETLMGEMLRFRDEKVGWVKMGNDWKIIGGAKSEVMQTLAYLPLHTRDFRAGGMYTLFKSQSGRKHGLILRTEEVTDLWAAVFYMKALYFLYSRCEGYYPAKETKEAMIPVIVGSLLVGLKAQELLAGTDYKFELEKAVVDYGFRGARDVIAAFGKKKTAGEICKRLDAAARSLPAKSAQEKVSRMSMHIKLLVMGTPLSMGDGSKDQLNNGIIRQFDILFHEGHKFI